jgi:hypothetical protein
MRQLNEQQAISIAKDGKWKEWTDEEVVKFQLYQERLCMNFNRFQEAVENVFGRPVFTHEFANYKRLQEEYEGTRLAPTFEEVVNLIPEEKRILIGL